MNLPMPATPAEAADAVRFFRAWLAAPLRTGSVAPSGPALSRAIASAVDPDEPGVVVELGPGTGAVTKALLERGVTPERLVLVETNPRFCALLRKRYPSATVLSADASRAPRMLREAGIGPVAAVVSGLPLVSFRRWRRWRVVLEWFAVGRPGMPFVQFTYFRGSPVPLGPGRITGEVSRAVWDNLYPAWVWVYRDTAAAETGAASPAVAGPPKASVAAA